MMVAMVVAQHDQIALSLEPEPRVPAMVHFEPIIVATQVAGVPGLLERQRPHPFPGRCP